MTRTTKKTLKLQRGELHPVEVACAGALVVLQGAPADIGLHRVIERTCVIGRGPGADMVLLDEHLSRRHCSVSPSDLGVLLEDLGSRNGTRVNGRRVDGPVLLADGDQVFIAETVLKFSAPSSSAELIYHASMDERVGTDELTGLVARHRFEGALTRALETCEAAHVPLGVMMLDLDGIKQINDTHGHQVGAFTIAEAGKIIGGLVAPAGMASRLGGDEFAAFLPRRSKRGTTELAQRLVQAVEEHAFDHEGLVLHPTISIGVAGFPEDGRTLEDLMRQADVALYRAKQAGRNRVET
jgi:diguanylate cyclase (GGDEF)-like protein